MNRDFGWDLPPGVRNCDLPGNRPEDEQLNAECEAFEEALQDLISSHKKSAEEMSSINIAEILVEQANGNSPEIEREQRARIAITVFNLLEGVWDKVSYDKNFHPTEIRIDTREGKHYILHILPTN